MLLLTCMTKELTDEEIKRIRSGLSIRRQSGAGGSTEQAAIDASGRLVAILVPREAGLLGPKRNFPPDE